MNIRQLEAFRAIVLAGTVNGAADLLSLSQPSISRLLAQLEQALSVVLFDRVGGRLVLTPEGQIIFEQVEHSFNALDRIQEFAKDIQHNRIGSLSIATMPALGIDFLPAAISEFCEQHVEVSISLSIQTSPKVEDWVAVQHMDFGLAQLPFSRDNLIADEFCDVPLYAVLPVGHPLSTKNVLAPSDFEALNFISLTRTNTARHLTDQLFSQYEVTRNMRLETSYLSAVCALVSAGSGVGLADPFSIYGRRGHLIVRPIEPTINFPVGLIYPAHRPLSKVGRAFITFLKLQRDMVFKEIETLARKG